MATYEFGLNVYNIFDVDQEKPWQLLSHYFPDKVGGKPAWLSLNPLPSPDVLQCGNCGKQCILLLQKYCPSMTFHRMIFIFICRDPSCSRKHADNNFVVLRSQLSFENAFYSVSPPDEHYFDMSSYYPRAENFATLCSLCGCLGPKRCGRCRKIYYCSKEHQTVDWKARHRTSCGYHQQDGDTKAEVEMNRFLFPEFLLDIHDESDDGIDQKNENGGSTCSIQLQQQELHHDAQFSTAELEEIAVGSVKEDKQFKIFKKTVQNNQSQVLRYHKGGTPLWVTDSFQLNCDEQIPCCEKCGAKRHFEFQVLPQLLNYLNVDHPGNSIDWATLAVYTCSADCMTSGFEYVPEFIFKQDFDT